MIVIWRASIIFFFGLSNLKICCGVADKKRHDAILPMLFVIGAQKVHNATSLLKKKEGDLNYRLALPHFSTCLWNSPRFALAKLRNLIFLWEEILILSRISCDPKIIAKNMKTYLHSMLFMKAMDCMTAGMARGFTWMQLH